MLREHGASTVATILWCIAGIVLTGAYLNGLLGSAEDAAVVLALLGGTHAFSSFWMHGGANITATGVFMLGLVTFVYFPAVYVATERISFAEPRDIPGAIILVFFSQVIMYHLTSEPQRELGFAASVGVAEPVAIWSTNLGVALIVAGYSLERIFGLGSSTLAGATAFSGAALVAVTALHNAKLSLWRFAFAAVACSFYVATMFSGGGRLVLGGLAMVVAVAITRQSGRFAKSLVTVTLPVGLSLLAANRAERTATLGGVETGLESVVWPFERFAQLLQLSTAGQLPHGEGSSFYATAVLFFPRSLWPEKPIGFGAELTEIFRPELVGTGHSEAALVHGELIFNFGLLSLLIIIPLSYFVRFLDRRLSNAQSQLVSSPMQILTLTATVLATAGLLDLVWVGTFGYMSRTGQRLLVLAAVYIVLAWNRRRTSNLMSATHSGRRSPRVQRAYSRFRGLPN